MLFGAIVREDRSLLDLIDADYTFVDERLARHYGIPDVRGSYFRRVPLDPASPRRGLLGQGSMLTVTSVATRTSPVSRGKWILENLLGAPPPEPPPGVETNLEQDPKAAKPTTLRQRLERTARIRCARRATRSWTRWASRWRISIWSAPGATATATRRSIRHGQLADGTPLNGPADLRQALLEPIRCVR